MAGSTAAALKAALKTAMAAEGALSAVAVSYGEPGELHRSEHIWIGSAVSGSVEPAVFRAGRVRRDEEYSLDVVIDVGSEPRPEDAETRAVLLGAVVEEMLADDPQVSNVTNLLWVIVDGFELDTVESSEGPRSTYTLTLQARGRLL